MLLTFLGTAGWMPSGGRETSAFLVRANDNALLLDAGTGISRLVTDPGLLAGIRRIDIVLSHFHLDHVIGLSYLDALKDVEIEVWGPGALLYGVASHDVLRRLLSPPLLRFDLTERIAGVRDVPGGTFRVNKFTIQTRHQLTHTSPSLAYRVNDDLAYCTDTEYDPGNIEFARGAHLLLHEAWTVTKPVRGHSTAAQAAEIAAAADVARLLLVHLPPTRPAELLRDDARRVFEPSGLPGEGTTLPIGE